MLRGLVLCWFAGLSALLASPPEARADALDRAVKGAAERLCLSICKGGCVDLTAQEDRLGDRLRKALDLGEERLVGIGHPQGGARREFQPGGGIVHVAAERAGCLEKTTDLHPVPTGAEDALRNGNRETGALLDVGLALGVAEARAGDLAAVDRDGERGSLEEKGRAPVVEKQLAARLVTDMLGQAEGEFPLGEHALEPGVAGARDGNLEAGFRGGFGGGLRAAQWTGKRQDGGRQDTEEKGFCFHGSEGRQACGGAVWGETPNPSRRAGRQQKRSGSDPSTPSGERRNWKTWRLRARKAPEQLSR